MGRPLGRRSADFDEKRREIARAARNRLLQPGGSSASLRELARAADVSLPTLRHYFGDRDGLVRAALEEARAQGEPWMRLGREAEPHLPLAASVRWFLDLLASGWPYGLGVTVSQSLAMGMDDPAVGVATVETTLEPMLQALEARLARHTAELAEGADLRHAALTLLAPVVLALLHQRSLSGSTCRPLAWSPFLDDHVRRWTLAWRR